MPERPRCCFLWQALTPISRAGLNMPCHRLRGRFDIRVDQGIHDGQVLVRFFGKTIGIVVRQPLFPGSVSKSPEENLQPFQLPGKKSVAARLGNQIMQLTVQPAGLVDKPSPMTFRRFHLEKRLGQGMQLRQCDSSTSVSDRFAFQRLPDLADLFNIAAGDRPDHAAAIGNKIDDADALQLNERFANRRRTHLHPPREVLNDEPLPRLEPSLEDVRE